MTRPVLFPKFEIKRGAPFRIELPLRDRQGAPLLFTNEPVRAQVRTLGTYNVTADLSGFLVDGVPVIEGAAAQTALWPLTTERVRQVCDVRVGSGDSAVVSDTFEFVVEREITEAVET